MTREDYIDEFIRHGSDLIPYNTPNYDEVLLERANKYADEMLNPDSELEKLCERHDSLIGKHSSVVEEQEDKEPIDNILYAAACGIKNTKIITEEDKVLLLKDICGRLPYFDLWVQYDNKDWLAIGYGHERIELLPNIFSSIAGPCPLIDEIKPYLRPMSSMTEEEKEEMTKMSTLINSITLVKELGDWLNAHHFDYHGLIPMGLALEAPKDMYKTE